MADGNASSSEDNCETIDEKISKLIQDWATLNVSPDGTLLQRTETLFRNTARLVLSAVDKVNAWNKSKLTLILHQCIQTVGSSCSESKALIEALSELLADPWGNPALRKILSCEERTETTSLHEYYCATENPQVLWLRLEVLESTNCEDLAQKLCSCCLHCGPLQGNAKLQVMNVRLLYRLRHIEQLTKEVKNYTSSEGKQLITRLLESDEHDKFEIAECINQVLLVRNMVLSTDHDSTKDLMVQWIDTHISKKTELSTLKQQVLKLCQLSTTSAHFYLMVDLLHDKFGDSLLQLYVELYIRALTVDINFMENARLTDPKEEVEVLENKVADSLCKLASFLGNHPTLARECILSAFSISPSKDRLAKLYVYACKQPVKAVTPTPSSLTNGVTCVPCSGDCHCDIKGECRRNLHQDSVKHESTICVRGETLPQVDSDTAVKCESQKFVDDGVSKIDVNVANLRNSLGDKLICCNNLKTQLERKLSSGEFSPLQFSSESVEDKSANNTASGGTDDGLASFMLDHVDTAPSGDMDFSSMVMVSECVVYTENVTANSPPDVRACRRNTPQSANQQRLNEMTEALHLEEDSNSEVDSDDEKLDGVIPEDIYTANNHILDYSEERLPEDVLRDLTIILDEPRSKILTWDLNWPELESRCKLYLEQRSLPTKLEECVLVEQTQTQADSDAEDDTQMDHDDAMIAVAELLVNELPLDKFSSDLLNQNLNSEEHKPSQDCVAGEYAASQPPEMEPCNTFLPAIEPPGSELLVQDVPIVQSLEVESVNNDLTEVESLELCDSAVSLLQDTELKSIGSMERNDETAEPSKNVPDAVVPLTVNNASVKLGASNMNPTVVISKSDISTARKKLDERSSFLKELLLSSKGLPYDRQSSHASNSVSKINIPDSKVLLNVEGRQSQIESLGVASSRPSTLSLLRASRPFEHSCLPQMAIPVIPVQKVDVSGLSTLDIQIRSTKPVMASLTQSNPSVNLLPDVSNTNNTISPSKSSYVGNSSPKVLVTDTIASTGRPPPTRPHPALPFLRTAIVSVQKLDLNATVRKLDAHLSATNVLQLKKSQNNSAVSTSPKTSVAKKSERVGATSFDSASGKSSVPGKPSLSPTKPHARQQAEKSNLDSSRLLLKSVSLPPSVQKVTVHHPLAAALTDKLASSNAESIFTEKVLFPKKNAILNEQPPVSKATASKPNNTPRSPLIVQMVRGNKCTRPELLAQSKIATVPLVKLPDSISVASSTNVTTFIPSVVPPSASRSGMVNIYPTTTAATTNIEQNPVIIVQDRKRKLDAVSVIPSNVSEGMKVSTVAGHGQVPPTKTPGDDVTTNELVSMLPQTHSNAHTNLSDFTCDQNVAESSNTIAASDDSMKQTTLSDSNQCHPTLTSQVINSVHLEVAAPKNVMTVSEVVNMLVESTMNDTMTVLDDCSGGNSTLQEPNPRQSVINTPLDLFWFEGAAASNVPCNFHPSACLSTAADHASPMVFTTTMATQNAKEVEILDSYQGTHGNDANSIQVLADHHQPNLPQMNGVRFEGCESLADSLLPVDRSCVGIPSAESSTISFVTSNAPKTECVSLHQVVSLPDLDASHMSLLEQIGDTQSADNMDDTLAKLNAYQEETDMSICIGTSCSDRVAISSSIYSGGMTMEPNACQTDIVASKENLSTPVELEKTEVPYSVALPVFKCNQVAPPTHLQQVTLQTAEPVVNQAVAIVAETNSSESAVDVEKAVVHNSIVLPVLKCSQVVTPGLMQNTNLHTLPVIPARINILPQVRMTTAVQPSISVNVKQEASVIKSVVSCAENQLLCATTGIGPPPINSYKVVDANDFITVPASNSSQSSMQQREASVVVNPKMKSADSCTSTSSGMFTVSTLTNHDLISKVIMNEFSDAKAINNSVIVSSSQCTLASLGPSSLLPNGTFQPACTSHTESTGNDEKCAISSQKTVLEPVSDFETSYKRFLLGGKSKPISSSLPASPVTSAPAATIASTLVVSTVSSVTPCSDVGSSSTPTSSPAVTYARPVYSPKLSLTYSNPTVRSISIPPRVSSAPPRATSPLLQTLVTTATQVWEGCDVTDKKGRQLLFPSKAERRKWIIVRNQHGGTECKKVTIQTMDCANNVSISEPLSTRVAKPRNTLSSYPLTSKTVILPPFSNFAASSAPPAISQPPAVSTTFNSTLNRSQSPRSVVTVTPSIRAPLCSTMSETKFEELCPSSTSFNSVDERTHTLMSTTSNILQHGPRVKPVVLPTPLATDFATKEAKNGNSSLIVGKGLLLENLVSSTTMQKPPMVFASKVQKNPPKPALTQREKKKAAKKPIKTSPADLKKIFEENANVAKILQNYQEEFKKCAAQGGANPGANSKSKTSKLSVSISSSNKTPVVRIPPHRLPSPKPRDVSPSSVSSSSSSMNSSPVAAHPAVFVTQVLPPVSTILPNSVSSMLTRLQPPFVVGLPIPKQPPAQTQTIKRHYLPPENLETQVETAPLDEPKKKPPAKKERKEPTDKGGKNPKKEKPDSPKLACPLCNKKMCSPFSVKRHLKSVHKSTGEAVIGETIAAPSLSSDIKTNLISSSNTTPCQITEQNVCVPSSVAELNETHQLKTVNLSENVTNVSDLCIGKKLNSPPRPSDLDNIDLDTLLDEEFDYPGSGFNLFVDPIAEDGLERNGSDEDLMKAKEEEDISRAFGLFCDPPREQSALDGELGDTPFTLFSDPEMPTNMTSGCSPVGGDVSRAESNCLSPVPACQQLSSEDEPASQLYESKMQSEETVAPSLPQQDNCSSEARWTKDRDVEMPLVDCEQLNEGIAAAAKNRTRARKTNAPCRCCDNDSATNVLNKKCRKDTKVVKPARTATRNRQKEMRRSSVRTNKR